VIFLENNKNFQHCPVVLSEPNDNTVKLTESSSSRLKRARASGGPLELDSANFGHLSIRPIEIRPFDIRPFEVPPLQAIDSKMLAYPFFLWSILWIMLPRVVVHCVLYSVCNPGNDWKSFPVTRGNRTRDLPRDTHERCQLYHGRPAYPFKVFEMVWGATRYSFPSSY
jgi:hypothetical protein